MIPIFSNTWGEAELAAIRRVAESRWLGSGEEVKALEAELARHFGVERLLLLNCATSGLYLALRALGLQPGQKVIMPAIHFVGAGNAVREMGGEIVFADVGLRTLNILPREIERLRDDRTWGVMVLHYGGQAAPISEIISAAEGLVVVEDAANGPATTVHGQAVGTFGDAGVWSFDSMKILVMADGGALWLRDEEAHQRVWRLRNCGLDSFSGSDSLGRQTRWWEFTVPEPSGRYDSNDVLAAVGRVQLGKLGQFVERRRAIWETYQRELAGVGDLMLPPEPKPGTTGSYYLYWVQTRRRDELARHLVERGIYCTFRYHPLYRAYGMQARLYNTLLVAERTLNLPLHQNLSDATVSFIVASVRGFFQ